MHDVKTQDDVLDSNNIKEYAFSKSLYIVCAPCSRARAQNDPDSRFVISPLIIYQFFFYSFVYVFSPSL